MNETTQRNGNGTLPPPAGRAAPAGLSSVEGTVLEALGPRPQTSKSLVKSTGYALKSVQNALGSLVRRRLAVHTPDGYGRNQPGGVADPLPALFLALTQLCDLVARAAAQPPEPIDLSARHAGLFVHLTVKPDAGR